MAVLFDATGTTSSLSGTDTFRQISYSFDFGDNRGESWAFSGQPKNIQVGGPLAAHVFDLPGTYTVRVTTTDAAGTRSQASVTITVHNPDSVYAGTQTLCVSPSANYTGCPAGAAQSTSLPSSYSGRRVLLRRGESFGSINMGHATSNAIVATYGSGAKPRVTSVRIGEGRPSSAIFPDDVTVMDLNVSNGIVQGSSASRLLLYRNDLADSGSTDNQITVGSALEYWAGSDPYRTVATNQFFNPREIFVVENRVIGSSTNLPHMNFQGSVSRLALLGNEMGTANQHTARLYRLHKSVIAHNALRGRSSDGIRHALKLHSGGLSAYADNYASSGSSWATRYVVIANNIFGDAADNNQWTVAVTPQNGQSVEGIEDVIVENNRYVRGSRTVTDLNITGRRIAYRGNISATSSSAASVSTGAHGGALPADWQGPYYSQ
nr:PKD domain-containing protein [Caldimonas caldifontis]